MIALRIAGIVVAALSVVALFITFKTMWHGAQTLQSRRTDDLIPPGLKARRIGWAWLAALVIGLVMISLSY